MLTSFQKPTISIRFNLLQVFPSVPTFVLAVLQILLLIFCAIIFYVSLNLVAGSRNLSKLEQWKPPLS